MARKPEQRLWDRMRNGLTRQIIGADHGKLHLQRVEDSLGSGLPDVIALFCARVTMIETKVAPHTPVRKSTPLLGANNSYSLNVDQRNWHLDWTRGGGRSMIVVSVADETVAPHWAVWGRYADFVNKWSAEEFTLHSALYMRGHNFWKALLELL